MNNEARHKVNNAHDFEDLLEEKKKGWLQDRQEILIEKENLKQELITLKSRFGIHTITADQAGSSDIQVKHQINNFIQPHAQQDLATPRAGGRNNVTVTRHIPNTTGRLASHRAAYTGTGHGPAGGRRNSLPRVNLQQEEVALQALLVEQQLSSLQNDAQLMNGYLTGQVGSAQ